MAGESTEYLGESRCSILGGVIFIYCGEGMKRFVILCFLFTMTLLLSNCSESSDERAIKHVRRGDEYARKEQFKEAVIEYKNAVDALPDNTDLRWKLSRAALKANDFGTAFGELRRVVNPHYAAISSNSLLC